MVDVIGGEPVTFSQSFSCPDCGISVSEVEPRSFSFNNPFGACPVCFGLGYKMEFDEDLMIPDKRLSINEGSHHGHGLAVLYGTSPALPMLFCGHWRRNIILIWILPSRIIPRRFMTFCSTAPTVKRSWCIIPASGQWCVSSSL